MTAFVINDRVKQTTTTTGTGTIDLSGTETGFETFVAGIGDGVQTYYAIVHDGTADFEVGTGTVTDAGTDTLSRPSNATVISSSNSDNLVDFGAGSKTVFCTLPAKKTISPVMDATPFVVTHASTLSLNQTIDSGVLAGPVTVTGTQTITGTVVVV
jgi:hypothetical protein|tara:strand:+ start:40 stop:507 length:468 start_codon:yes stop_codon:yes gene_type:complete